jgi:Tat protein secretion system quality control protein TatD with DNase activity
MENDIDYLIDSHCHLQYFTEDQIYTIVEKSKESGINYLLTNSTYSQDFDYTFQLAKFANNLFGNTIIPGIGHHPWYLEDIKETWYKDVEDYILNLENSNINYFIGEIGIDGGRPKKYFFLLTQKSSIGYTD